MSKTTIHHFNPELFKQVRIASDFTVPRLSEESTVSTATIYSWERGKNRPTVEALSIVMAVLGRGMGEVLDFSVGSATLHDLRILAGVTRAEVVEKLGMSTSGWGSVERGEVVMTLDKAGPLSELFGVSPTIIEQAARNTLNK